MVEYRDVTIRLRDKTQVKEGLVVKAKMKWWGGIDFQYPFVWKDGEELKHSFSDPRIQKEQQQKTTHEPRRNIEPKKVSQQNNKGPKRKL